MASLSLIYKSTGTQRPKTHEVLAGRLNEWHCRRVLTPGAILESAVEDVPRLTCRGPPSSLYLSSFTGQEGGPVHPSPEKYYWVPKQDQHLILRIT